MVHRLIIILILLLLAAPAHALDGEVSFGVVDGNLHSYPHGGLAKYVSTIEIGHQVKMLRPFVEITTLMSGQNGDGSFNPDSVEWNVGIRADIYKGVFIEASHSCWHGIYDPTPGVEMERAEKATILRIGWEFGR